MTNPYRTRDAKQFDYLMTAVIKPTNTIRLGPGRFHTAGITGTARFGLQFKDGWKLRGAGVDMTTIVIDPIAQPPNPLSYWSVLGGRQNSSANGATHNAEVSDLTVDMNVQAHSTNPGVRFGAVLLGGHNTRISRVKVINWGSTIDVEQFLLVINQHDGGVWTEIMTNCVIEDCIIGPPAPVALKGGTSAICIVSNPPDESTPGPGWIRDAEIRGCFVNGVETVRVTGGIGKPRYFNALGMGSTVRGRIRDNIVTNITGPSSAACYWECDSNLDFVVENNTFQNILIGIHLRGEVCNSPTLVRRNVFFRNNLITTATGGVGILFGGKPGISIPQNVEISGNTIQAHQGAGAATQAIYIRHAAAVNVANNTLDANGGVDLLIGDGVSKASVTNNKKLSGQAVTATGSYVRTATEER